MEKTFEQIETLWQQQDERLQHIEHVQQESVRRLLHRSITSTHRRFLIENISAVVLASWWKSSSSQRRKCALPAGVWPFLI